MFIALPLPASLIPALRAIQTAPFPARWQSEAQLHLTLGFLGDVAERDAAAVDDALAAVSAPPLTLSLAGVGHFAEGKRAYSLWAGVSPREPVTALAAKIADACRRAGHPIEQRRYVPHITVARMRMDEQAVVPWLIAHGSLDSAPVIVHRFALFQSHLGPEGARYEQLVDYPLR